MDSHFTKTLQTQKLKSIFIISRHSKTTQSTTPTHTEILGLSIKKKALHTQTFLKAIQKEKQVMNKVTTLTF